MEWWVWIIWTFLFCVRYSRFYQLYQKSPLNINKWGIPIHVYINRINNRLVFKIKDGYKLKLQTPETMKLFGSTKKLIDKTKNREKVPSFEVAEVVLVQYHLGNNQYQQNSKVLYNFTSNKTICLLVKCSVK